MLSCYEYAQTIYGRRSILEHRLAGDLGRLRQTATDYRANLDEGYRLSGDDARDRALVEVIALIDRIGADFRPFGFWASKLIKRVE